MLARPSGAGHGRPPEAIAGDSQVNNNVHMTDKPSYMDLLNRITLGEGNAECYLNAWVATTPRADVRQVISTIALREGEHAKAFAKRMCELGYEVEPCDDPELTDKMAIASSTTLSDMEKFQRLNLDRLCDPSTPDVFGGMFADTTIDIQTGALLGRYIAEERDTGRRLSACLDMLVAEEEATASKSKAKKPTTKASTKKPAAKQKKRAA
jgi:rubrerythrin